MTIEEKTYINEGVFKMVGFKFKEFNMAEKIGEVCPRLGRSYSTVEHQGRHIILFFF